MEPVTAAAISAGVTVLVAGGTAFYGYGRLNAKVETLETRQAEDKATLAHKIESKADKGAFEELHKDVREIRDGQNEIRGLLFDLLKRGA